MVLLYALQTGVVFFLMVFSLQVTLCDVFTLLDAAKEGLLATRLRLGRDLTEQGLRNSLIRLLP